MEPWGRATGVIIRVRKASSADDPPNERLVLHLVDGPAIAESVGERRSTGETGDRRQPWFRLTLTARHLRSPCRGLCSPDSRTGTLHRNRRPTLTAQSTVTVPESGVVPSLKLKLK